MSDIRTDVAIVGAGIMGLSTALSLAESGVNVVVLEANAPGWGASGRNGGQVNSGLKHDPEIIERVNRFFGYRAVARIKLRQGAVQAPPAKDKPKAPPSLKPIPMELGDSLRDIGDPELRTVLEALARGLGSHNEGQDET
jgi:hypothetical protein